MAKVDNNIGEYSSSNLPSLSNPLLLHNPLSERIRVQGGVPA
jgi:hypothetical protein